MYIHIYICSNVIQIYYTYNIFFYFTIFIFYIPVYIIDLHLYILYNEMSDLFEANDMYIFDKLNISTIKYISK